MSIALRSVVSNEKLEELLKTLSDGLDLPIRLLDEGGEQCFIVGAENGYCSLLKKRVFHANECAITQSKAGRSAQKLGESYIFSCDANLTNVAYPLLYHNELLGTVLVGPFLLDEPDSTFISDLSERYDMPAALSLALYDELKGLRVIAPARVRQISRLIDAVLSPLLPGERLLLLERQEKLYQQSRIGEAVQVLKEGEASENNHYPFQMEQDLLVKVKMADLPAAKAILNDLLGYVLFTEGNRMDAVTKRAVELCTLLSRVAIGADGENGNLYALNQAYIARLEALSSYEDICYQLQEIIESFVLAVSQSIAKNGNTAVRKAIVYIGSHYMQDITLSRLADVVGLTPAYFSALFKHVTGIGFREQINRVRVEEAKNLLTATRYSLSEIAVSVGFSDQSYFSKVFKRLTGLSPNRYR